MSDISIAQAVEAVRQQARVFQAVIMVGDALAGIRDLEQHVAETQGLAEAAQARLKSLSDALVQGDEELARVKGETASASAERDNAVAYALQLRQDAEKNAHAAAQVIVDEAKALADAIGNDVVVSRDTHAETLKVYAAEEAEAQKRIDDLNAEFAALKGRLG